MFNNLIALILIHANFQENIIVYTGWFLFLYVFNNVKTIAVIQKYTILIIVTLVVVVINT